MPTFNFRCPHCGQKFEAEEAWIGQNATCGNCQRDVVIKKTITQSNILIQGTGVLKYM